MFTPPPGLKFKEKYAFSTLLFNFSSQDANFQFFCSQDPQSFNLWGGGVAPDKIIRDIRIGSYGEIDEKIQRIALKIRTYDFQSRGKDFKNAHKNVLRSFTHPKKLKIYVFDQTLAHPEWLPLLVKSRHLLQTACDSSSPFFQLFSAYVRPIANSVLRFSAKILNW